MERIFSFELKFIVSFRNDFFNQKADLMKANDLVVKPSDWIFLSLIDCEKLKPKMPRMVLELKDHAAAPSTATLQPLGRDCKRHRARSGDHTYGSKSIFDC